MRFTFPALAALALFVTVGSAWQAAGTGPYKVLKTAKTGGLGGFDYIYADVAGRRLYIPRSGGAPNATPPLAPRITVFDLDTLAPAGEVPDIRANGAAVDAASGHGFVSSKPVAMFDTKTLKVIKTIDVQGNPDGILQDAFNQRIYILSHAAPHVTVIDVQNPATSSAPSISAALRNKPSVTAKATSTSTCPIKPTSPSSTPKP